MFGGAEMTRGDLQGQDCDRLVATLTTFSGLVRDFCVALGLGPGQTPFTRPANFMAVLTLDAIHLVVDDSMVGGMPDHSYFDRRAQASVMTLDAVLGASVREFGFQKPVGVSLPIVAYTDNERQRKEALKASGNPSKLATSRQRASANTGSS